MDYRRLHERPELTEADTNALRSALSTEQLNLLDSVADVMREVRQDFLVELEARDRRIQKLEQRCNELESYAEVARWRLDKVDRR